MEPKIQHATGTQGTQNILSFGRSAARVDEQVMERLELMSLSACVAMRYLLPFGGCYMKAVRQKTGMVGCRDWHGPLQASPLKIHLSVLP